MSSADMLHQESHDVEIDSVSDNHRLIMHTIYSSLNAPSKLL